MVQGNWMQVMRNVKFCVRVAVLAATGLAGWVGVLTLFRGQELLGSLGMTYWGIVMLYFAGAIVAGSIIGLLLPLTRSLIGAALVGYLAALPVMGGIILAVLPTVEMAPGAARAVVGRATTLSSIVGALVGIGVWASNRYPFDASKPGWSQGMLMLLGFFLGTSAVGLASWLKEGSEHLVEHALWGGVFGAAIGRFWWHSIRIHR